jgi:DNA-binding transcriptional MerR regulator
MKNGLFTVKEMAALRGTTAETLRHYDRIGLFKPDSVDRFTGYRYYSIGQYERLGTILELRELGVSTAEIKDYFSDRRLEKSIRILNKHYRLLTEEVNKKEAMKSLLGNKLKTLESIIKDIRLNSIIEEDLEGRSVLTHGVPIPSANRLLIANEITRLEQNLSEVAPILASDRMCCYTDSYDFASGGGFDVVPAIVLDRFTKAEKQGTAIIENLQAGRYISVYHNSKFGEYNKMFGKIDEYLRRNKYIVAGRIVQVYKIDVTMTDDFGETVIKTEVPVEKK